MSPTEADLRAALRDGEGDGPDAGRIIALGQAQHSQRRTRLLSTVAVVGFVAAGAIGVASLNNRSGDDTKHSSAAKYNSAAGGAAARSSAAVAPGATRNALASTPATCPTSYDFSTVTTPTDPGAPLFDKPVSTVLVCAYIVTTAAPTGSTRQQPVSITLTGADARAVADTLENAATKPDTRFCPLLRTAGPANLLILATTADGEQLPPVRTAFRWPVCNSSATNGTAVRYDWMPPTGLRQKLISLTRVTVQPGGNKGSPLH